jgi:hypothetical protein
MEILLALALSLPALAEETYQRCYARAVACDQRACAPPTDPLNCGTREHFEECAKIRDHCFSLPDSPLKQAEKGIQDCGWGVANPIACKREQ